MKMDKMYFYDFVWDQAGFLRISLYGIIEFASDDEREDKEYELREKFREDKFDDGFGLPHEHKMVSKDELLEIRDVIDKVLK